MLEPLAFSYLNDHDKNLEYQERMVAFVDILGFKELVMERKNIPIIAGILTALTGSKDHDKQTSQFGIRTAVISDTIILSSEDTKNIPKFLNAVNALLMFMAVNNILARGAISIGGLYHDENIVFGPALVTAYLLEKEKANYPRVIFDERTISQFSSDVNQRIRTADDGVAYYDFLGDLQKQRDRNQCAAKALDHIKSVCEHYLSGNVEINSHVKGKYIWLNDELKRVGVF